MASTEKIPDWQSKTVIELSQKDSKEMPVMHTDSIYLLTAMIMQLMFVFPKGLFYTVECFQKVLSNFGFYFTFERDKGNRKSYD